MRMMATQVISVSECWMSLDARPDQHGSDTPVGLPADAEPGTVDKVDRGLPVTVRGARLG
ncbi:hypothetical protein ACIRP2_36930 [Streptomyces sp. NPDC101194]|uniref:hypothetical protein n=1 Tax=Streptomyces sp. NPDC101194 TaxID=3366127 RepID=UPI0038115264